MTDTAHRLANTSFVRSTNLNIDRQTPRCLFMTKEIREFSNVVMAERAFLGDASGKHSNKATDWVRTVPVHPVHTFG